MQISRPQILRENGQVVYQVKVTPAEGGQTILWYSVEESFQDLMSDGSDAALVALLIPAMAMGEDIYIAGSISERLLYNASRPLQGLLKSVMPKLCSVKIFPETVSSASAGPAGGVATGFSGGVDSYSVLADNYANSTLDGFKVTHLLFNNVGSHGHGSQGEALFKLRYERLVPAANALGLPFVMVNSNLDSFYNFPFNFKQTHTLRNASVSLLLQKGIGRFMYASAYHYRDVFIGPTDSFAHSDLVSLPLLSTATLDAFSVGSEYTRVEKTLGMATVPNSHKMLDVCVRTPASGGSTNCSECWKCLRTLATLDIGGHLSLYADAFDLDRYRRMRRKYFASVLGSKDPLVVEILDLARQRNYQIPVASRMLHAFRVYPAIGFLNRLLLKVKRVGGV